MTEFSVVGIRFAGALFAVLGILGSESRVECEVRSTITDLVVRVVGSLPEDWVLLEEVRSWPSAVVRRVYATAPDRECRVTSTDVGVSFEGHCGAFIPAGAYFLFDPAVSARYIPELGFGCYLHLTPRFAEEVCVWSGRFGEFGTVWRVEG